MGLVSDMIKTELTPDDKQNFHCFVLLDLASQRFRTPPTEEDTITVNTLQRHWGRLMESVRISASPEWHILNYMQFVIATVVDKLTQSCSRGRQDSGEAQTTHLQYEWSCIKYLLRL